MTVPSRPQLGLASRIESPIAEDVDASEVFAASELVVAASVVELVVCWTVVVESDAVVVASDVTDDPEEVAAVVEASEVKGEDLIGLNMSEYVCGEPRVHILNTKGLEIG